jgi:serine/threonine protein kinase
MTVPQVSTLDDRYELGDLIGRGGMADVYRATDRLLGRQVAVKVLRETTEGTHRDRFVEEARTLASLNHRGLITLLDAGFEADHPYLVMELVEGPTLAEAIGGAPMPPERVGHIGHQLADVLAYAHEVGVVHRDVKPSNVLLRTGDRALLADFGIARLVGATEHHTRTGEAIGSPAYLAPEQVAGEPLTPAADMFSLGLVLLEALTGARAYTGSPIETAVSRLTTPPVIPVGVPAAWRSLITRMTHRDPADRPTAAQVATELAAATSTGAPSGPWERSAEATGSVEITREVPLAPSDSSVVASAEDAPARRRRGRWWVVALLAVVVAVAAGVLVLTNGGTGTGTDPEPVLPSGVPTRLQQPLSDLHQAVEGHDQ